MQMELQLPDCLLIWGVLGPMVIYASAAPNVDNQHVVYLLCGCRTVTEQ